MTFRTSLQQALEDQHTMVQNALTDINLDVRFLVAGQVFLTSEAAIKASRCTLLKSMISGKFEIEFDPQGNIMLHEPLTPDTFRFVVELINDGKVTSQAASFEHFERVQRAFDYLAMNIRPRNWVTNENQRLGRELVSKLLKTVYAFVPKQSRWLANGIQIDVDLTITSHFTALDYFDIMRAQMARAYENVTHSDPDDVDSIILYLTNFLRFDDLKDVVSIYPLLLSQAYADERLIRRSVKDVNHLSMSVNQNGRLVIDVEGGSAALKKRLRRFITTHRQNGQLMEVLV